MTSSPMTKLAVVDEGVAAGHHDQRQHPHHRLVVLRPHLTGSVGLGHLLKHR